MAANPLDDFKKAKELVKAGDAQGALRLLKSIASTSAKIESCPACGVESLRIEKSTVGAAECSSCGALWGSKHASAAPTTLIKSGGTEDSTKMMKGKPEIVERLWAVWMPGDDSLTAFDINEYTRTGFIRKSCLEKIGIVVQEDLIKKDQIAKASDLTWGGLSKEQVLNTLVALVKSGEERNLINRYTINKFAFANEIDEEVLKAVLAKNGKDTSDLSKDTLQKGETVKLEDRDGADTRLDGGQGLAAAQKVFEQNSTVSNLEELRVKNPANGSDENEMKNPKAMEPKAMKKNLFFAPEGNGHSWIAGSKQGIYKSRAIEGGYLLDFYPTAQNRFLIAKNNPNQFVRIELGGLYKSREDAHEVAEKHSTGEWQAALKKAAEPAVQQPVSDAAPKLGHHFIFSAENAAYPNKRTVSGTHEHVLEGLKRQGMDAHGTKGKYGRDERAIVVHNPKPEHIKHLHQLASGLGQESAIESDGENHKMVFYHGDNAGKWHSGKGTEHFSSPPDDYYTEQPKAPGNYFRHNFDFDKLHGEMAKAMGGKIIDASSIRGTPGGAKGGFGLDPKAPKPSPYAKPGALTSGYKAAKDAGVKKPAVLKMDASCAPGGVGSKPGDTLMKDPVDKSIPPIAGGVEKAAPPAIADNKAIEAKQSAEPEAKVHSLTAPKVKAPGMDAKISALHAALGISGAGKKISKNEALEAIYLKMRDIRKSQSVDTLGTLRKWAELAAWVDLTKAEDWEA